jgi:hypothetical protein
LIATSAQVVADRSFSSKHGRITPAVGHIALHNLQAADQSTFVTGWLNA